METDSQMSTEPADLLTKFLGIDGKRSHNDFASSAASGLAGLLQISSGGNIISPSTTM